MLSALLVATVVSQPYFDGHSNMWLNLHHVLFELGRRERVAQGAELWGPPPFDLGIAEDPAWKPAVEHYAKTWSDRDLLFDDDLFRIKGLLAAHEADETLSDPALPPETQAVLNTLAPVYRAGAWPKHDAANRAWLADRERDIAAHGAAIIETLQAAFDTKFPKAPIRVDLVAVGNWGGAYTTVTPNVHLVAATLDPRDQGLNGTEILFHEAAHAMTDRLDVALGPTAPKNLWHAILFYTVGEAVRRQWPEHVPYAESQGLYEKGGWGDFKAAIDAHWATRLDGKPSLQTAADRINKQLGTPDPDLAAARDQTVVTGTRTERRAADAVVPTEVVTRQQLEAIGARNLEQLLLQQPGVEMEYSFRGAAVSLQGLGPEYVLVLVDGERQTGRVGNVLDLTRFSLRDVERIEIIKGPAAALYGSDAIGGVINLITRRPTKALELQGRLQGGFSNGPPGGLKADVVDARAHAATKLGPFEGRGGFGYQTYGAYDWDPSDVATSGAGFRRWDFDVALAANLFDKVRVTAKTDYLRRDVTAIDIAPSGATFDRRQRSEQFNVSVRGDAQLLESTHVALWGHLGLFRDQLQQDQRGAAFLDTFTASLDRLYSVDLQVDHKTGDHTVSLGAQFLAESLYSSRLSRLGERYRVGVFAQDEWDVPGLGAVKMKVLPGVRVDVDSQFGSAPTPRLAVKLDPAPSVTLRASYGWGFRAPSFQELYLLFQNTSVGYVVEGNPSLKAETSQAINVAADVRLPLEGWVASASFFHTNLNNLINVDTSAPIDPINTTRFRYDNVASAYAQGLETSLRMRLSRGAYFDLAYVLTDARDNVRRAALAGRAVHKVSAQLTAKYRPTGLEGVVRATYLGPRPF
ncbi:MAG: TonB-dependent receptor, partial [Myxococcaceae bacterium]|nr:TonB-dependent receptor [Myxococcaceae bacterium]